MGHGGARMSDIRLEEIPFVFDGRRYLLRCNMNVLADVQEVFDGRIVEALNGENPTRSVLEFLAAMLNDYSDEQGWPERFTSRTLGRKLSPAMLPSIEIMGLVSRAITPPKARSDQNAREVSEPDTDGPGESGN